ncbi:MAG: hypothetical protein K0R38_6826 [Polyangiaceae bacterium]|nr:hypothetical protein [Polyangiaceae bacterium]
MPRARSAPRQAPPEGAQLSMAAPGDSRLAALQAELAARDKTIEVLIARVEGQFAKNGS